MEKKYLNVYRSEGEFGQTYENIDNKNPNTSYVAGSGTHFGDTPYFGSEDAVAGDILLTNGGGKFFVNPDHYVTLRDEGKIGTGDGYMTPIGVCAIPGRLTLKGEDGENKGKTRVVSLANMSLKTPEVGSIGVGGIEGDNSMVWGDNTKEVGTFGDGNGNYLCLNLNTGELRGDTWGWSCSTSFTNQKMAEVRVNKFDPKRPTYSGLRGEMIETYPLCSPYDNTGGFFSGTLRYFQGKENTNKIISLTTANWSGNTIENSHASGHFPAACSCKRYTTKGTNSGDWYLPTVGELFIMWARMKEVNDSMELIGPCFGICVGTLKQAEQDKSNFWINYGGWLWSSTESEKGSNKVRVLYCINGISHSYLKSDTDNCLCRTRAFLAV